MITMVLGGLWHGAGWNFVFWGFLHGSILCLTRAWQRWHGTEKRVEKLDSLWTISKYVFCVFLTFNFLGVGWIFFRSASFEKAWAMIRQISTLTYYTPNLHTWVVIALVVGLVSHYVPKRLFEWTRNRFAASPWYVQGALLFVVAYVLRESASAEAVPFIYFQF